MVANVGARVHETKSAGTEVPADLHFYGADDEIRTRDPHLGKVMLYQLSHVRVERTPYQLRAGERKALPGRGGGWRAIRRRRRRPGCGPAAPSPGRADGR